MIANYYDRKIFYLNKYDLKGQSSIIKFINFSVNPTLPNTFIYEPILKKKSINALRLHYEDTNFS